MSVMDEFSERFNCSQSAWTKEQWKQVAMELASRLESTIPTPTKRGRPRNTDSPIVVGKDGKITVSQKSNYAALAWQVTQRMEHAKANGRKLTMKDAVREELVATIQRHNAATPDQRGERNGELRESRANEMLATAYTEVRKLMKKHRALSRFLNG